MPARFSPYVRLRRRGDSRIARLFDMCAGRGRLIAAPPENLGSPRRGRRPRRSALPPLKGEVAEPLAAKPEGSQIHRKGACSLDFALLTTPQSPPSNGGDSSPCRGAHAAHPAGDGVRLAVPGKHIGLTLFLVFSDRCGNCRFPSSATGGGNPQFLDVPIEIQEKPG